MLSERQKKMPPSIQADYEFSLAKADNKSFLLPNPTMAGTCIISFDEPCLDGLAESNFPRQVLAGALKLRGESQKSLFDLARARRSEAFPAEEVESRSVVELSNVCQQSCNYCSMYKEGDLERYVIKTEQVLEMAELLYSRGRRVLLFQSGENRSKAFVDYVSKCVSGVKAQCPDIEIILCLGNLSHDQYAQLKDAGAGRYIIKFESSSPEL